MKKKCSMIRVSDDFRFLLKELASQQKKNMRQYIDEDLLKELKEKRRKTTNIYAKFQF